MTPVSIAHMLRLVSMICNPLFMGLRDAETRESRYRTELNGKKRNEYQGQALV